jgi:hypothetical protein
MTAKEINKWNDLSREGDLDSAKSFVQGILLVLELNDTVQESIRVMKKQLDSFTGSIQRCNFIVGWEDSGLTVAVEEKEGKLNTKDAYVFAQNIPVMWEEREANQLARAIKNGSGVHPRVFIKSTWYRKQIARLEKQGIEWRKQRNIEA